MKSIKARNSRNSNKKIRGLALLEILIAIGILGIISAGVATLASRTFEEQNASLINKSVTAVIPQPISELKQCDPAIV
ncbi:prepilin-type N-terminal cleavage/methylation domain-containing protein, partial [Vibrio aestuarianus]|uniref:prepilin-type N-terminal cleavage/methylation domain-containing protein n=1 Tax=Vibrio aestuarianus TaxID=28171 RepID=UPI00237CE759